jgi:hypothetical protein
MLGLLDCEQGYEKLPQRSNLFPEIRMILLALVGATTGHFSFGVAGIPVIQF